MSDESVNSEKKNPSLFEELDYTEAEIDEAIQALFEEDVSAVDDFTEILTEESRPDLEKGLLSVFDDRYQEFLSAYDAEKDVEGKEIAKNFVESTAQSSAMDYIVEFEEWTEERFNDLSDTKSIVVQSQEFEKDRDYFQAVKGYSVRKLVHEKQYHSA